MIIVNKTCEHCGVTYGYHMSGAGCDGMYNNDRYCPDCMEVIVEALRKVPVKITDRIKEIECSEDLLKKLNTIRENENKRLEKLEKENEIYKDFPRFKRIFYDEYDVIETYYDDKGFKYFVKWNDDTPEDKHYFQLYEWDLINKEFKRPYINYSADIYHTNEYYKEHSADKSKSIWYGKELVPVKPLSPPNGSIFWTDTIDFLNAAKESEVKDSSVDYNDVWKENIFNSFGKDIMNEYESKFKKLRDAIEKY